MRPELERLFLIEQQLLPSPAALSAAEWRLRLLLDSDLQADAEAQQQLYDGLRAAGRLQLRRELAGIHATLYPQRPGFGLHRLAAWLRAWRWRN
jgi:hypothetical protein